MRTRHLALLLAAPALAGCLVLRAGGGATAERVREDGGRRAGPGRFDAELGLVLPVDGRDRGWLLSALAVHRERRAEDVGWTLLALEVARPAHPPGEERSPPLDRMLGWSLPPGLRDTGLRLEVGRSARGGYLGTAAKATFRLDQSMTLTGVLSAGVNSGPDHGPSAGLHLLFGWN